VSIFAPTAGTAVLAALDLDEADRTAIAFGPPDVLSWIAEVARPERDVPEPLRPAV
jgi:hypothetical protein